MINPVLTVFFDAFLITSALVIAAALIDECRASHQPGVGHVRRHAARTVRMVRHTRSAPQDFRREVIALRRRRAARLAA